MLTQGPEPTCLLLDGPITTLAPLEGLSGIQDLDLFWHVSHLNTEDFEVLPRLASLTTLGCDGKLSDDIAMHHIGKIPTLRSLRAQATTATEQGFVDLARPATLEKLWTGRDPINLTRGGWNALAQMPTITTLGISLANLDQQALAQLPHFRSLLEITPIDLTDEGFLHIGKCTQLKRLSCMYCRESSDIATQYIANLNLTSYYAGLTRIMDHSLALLSKMESLESIELFETRHITDEGLKHLVNLPKLKELNLGAVPGVTLAGTQIFNPRVAVRYDA